MQNSVTQMPADIRQFLKLQSDIFYLRNKWLNYIISDSIKDDCITQNESIGKISYSLLLFLILQHFCYNNPVITSLQELLSGEITKDAASWGSKAI